MGQELAKRQICRTLASYSAGMSRGQLYAKIECSISYRDFTVALHDLEDDAIIEVTTTSERGAAPMEVVRISDKTRAAAVAA